MGDNLKLRHYKPSDAENINYKYLDCNGDCEEPDNFYPMTLVDECGPVGQLILRYTKILLALIFYEKEG